MRTVIAVVVVMALVLAGCTSSEAEVRRVLEDEGYTDIAVGGWAPMDCGRDDSLRTRFTARRGERVVHGTVCCGLFFKDCTVRH